METQFVPPHQRPKQIMAPESVTSNTTHSSNSRNGSLGFHLWTYEELHTHFWGAIPSTLAGKSTLNASSEHSFGT
jgi:hypothetical protein